MFSRAQIMSSCWIPGMGWKEFGVFFMPRQREDTVWNQGLKLKSVLSANTSISTALQLGLVVWKLLDLFWNPGLLSEEAFVHQKSISTHLRPTRGELWWEFKTLGTTGAVEEKIQSKIHRKTQLSEFKLPRFKPGALERKKEQVQKAQGAEWPRGKQRSHQRGLRWRREEGQSLGKQSFKRPLKPLGYPVVFGPFLLPKGISLILNQYQILMEKSSY